MQTDSIILIALVINLVIATAAFAVPRILDRRARAAAIDAAALRAAAGDPAVFRGATGDLAAARGAAADSAASGAAAGDTATFRDGAGEPAGVRPLPVFAALDAGAPWFPRPDPGSGLHEVQAAPVATDPETGFDLVPSWARWLGEEEARVRRYHRPATIVLVELSGFDRLAERFGDDAAQRLIPPIAATMRRNARATDHLARLGPTRFGAILTETDEIRAINFLERVRSACDVWLEAGAVTLRLSVGWAEISPDRPAEVALPEAERRLYEERQRTWATLSRQTSHRDVESGIFEAARA
jgi:diguanylate cyclase (GGDEF)-like protein